MRTQRPLPDRFYQPLTSETLAILLEAQSLLNSEAQRISRVCDYWQREIISKRPRALKAV